MRLTAREFEIEESSRAPDGNEHTYLAVPARDQAYNFKVLLYCTKLAGRRRRINSSAAEADDLNRVANIARVAVRETARNFSIYEPAAAEQAINERLDSELDNAYHKDRSLLWRWEARAEITLPDEVLGLMRSTCKAEYQIMVNAKATALRMAETEGLRQQWDLFLDEAAKSQNAQHAVRLAEHPDDIAGTLEEVLNGRRERAEELITLLGKIVEVQRSVDIFELVARSDTVLRKTLEMMGIELPGMEGDALLASLADDI
jgi:hypothetical protein